MPDRTSRLWSHLAIAGVCALAWAIFVFHLDYESMWIDEHYSWRISRLGPTALVELTASDVHPPLYYLWLWVWLTWTGADNLFVMRLTAVIPAVLAVAFAYRLGVDWLKSRWAGLGAALFLATSGVFIYYARELRMYGLIVLLTCFSWWALYRLVERRRYGLALYALSLAAMAYTFYFSAFAVAAQIVSVLVYYRRRIGRVLAAFGIAAVSFLPWLPTFFRQLAEARAQSGQGDAAPLIGKFLGTTPTSPESISAFVSAYTAGQPAFVFLLIALALALGLAQPGPQRRWLAAAALWLFLTPFLFFAINLLIPIYGLRYVLTIAPALALVVGAALWALPGARAQLAIFALIGAAGVMAHTTAFPPPKAPHRELLRTVALRYQPGDRIWYNMALGALGSSLRDEVAYHLERDAPNLNTDWFIWDAPNEYRDPKVAPRVWDIRPYWIPIPDQARGPLVTGRVITQEWQFDGYTVQLYEAPPPDQVPARFGDVFEALTGGTDSPGYRPGETVLIKTWWRALRPPLLDYSYVLRLRPEDALHTVTQADGGLLIDDKPTSQFAPADSWSYTPLRFTLPADLPPGRYQLALGVYFYQDANNPLTVNGQIDTPVAVIEVAG